MTMRANPLPDDLARYVTSLYAAETDDQRQIREQNIETDQPIFVGQVEGKILELLCHMVQTKRALEIGCLHGYSASWLSKAAEEVISLEHDAKRAKIARDNMTHHGINNVTIIEGPANESLQTLKGSFDLVFIDADKTGYPDYYAWAKEHVRPGGVIVCDNTLMDGTMVSDAPHAFIKDSTRKAMRAFNEMVAQDEEVVSVLLPFEDGLTIALKR